jgi:cytochrome b561
LVLVSVWAACDALVIRRPTWTLSSEFIAISLRFHLRRSGGRTWGAIAKLLHWAIAVCIMIMIVMGIMMKWFLAGDQASQFQAYQLQKSFGFLLLLFALARLLWRLSAKAVPAASVAAKRHEHWLAKGVHAALYVAMIGMPISGLLATSASPMNVPTVIFGVLTLPRPIGPDAALATLSSGIHFWLACLLVVSVSLHVAGAIRHAVVLRDGVLQRMAPGGRSLGAASNPGRTP